MQTNTSFSEQYHQYRGDLWFSESLRAEKMKPSIHSLESWITKSFCCFFKHNNPNKALHWDETIVVISNKNDLTAAFSVACLEIRSRNEEPINTKQHSLAEGFFYFLLYRRRYFDTFYFFPNWFCTRGSDVREYVCGRRLYECINTRKFKGLDSREITSLSEIKKVIYLARHFNHRRK